LSGRQNGEDKTDIARERFLASVRQSQWLPERDWPIYQGRLLERLVRHAWQQTDFYRDALAVLFRSDGSIDWDRWSEVPLLTREMAQANNAAMTARAVPELSGRASVNQTSGSTSRSFKFLVDDLSSMASYCLSLRFFEWHGIDPHRTHALIKSYYGDPAHRYPEGSRSKGWHVSAPEVDNFRLHISATIDEQIDWLRRRRPDYLTTYPSNMLALAQSLGPEGARSLCLSGYFSYGEAFDGETRKTIEDYFQAPMLDRYGATEVGQVSAQCAASTKQHVSMENVLFELLDDAGNPVAPGETGRIVVTAFYNYSMPFIRYDIGDYAVLSTDQCGRSLPAIERIVGRARCMFRFKDGSVKWPDTKSVEIREFLPHKQLQIVQTHVDKIDVRIVPQDENQIDDLTGLARYFQSRLHPSLSVNVSKVAQIPRAPSGKFFDYYSQVDG